MRSIDQKRPRRRRLSGGAGKLLIAHLVKWRRSECRAAMEVYNAESSLGFLGSGTGIGRFVLDPCTAPRICRRGHWPGGRAGSLRLWPAGVRVRLLLLLPV